MKCQLLALFGFIIACATQGFHLPFSVPSRKSATRLFDTMDDGDWRAFRAKLILQEQEEREGSTASKNLALGEIQGTSRGRALSDGQEHWIHEQTILEPGSVLIHTPRSQDIYGLGRQCLYQSVVLILETNPQETIGIVVNRRTDITLDPIGATINYGGDDNSLHSSSPRWYVLDSEEIGIQIVPGLSLTTVEEAQNVISHGKASVHDFSVYCGHVSWPTNVIRLELERGVWMCLSVDVDTFRQKCDDKDCRDKLLATVSNYVPHPLCDFDERMHREWSRVHLSMVQYDSIKNVKRDSIKIKAGDLLRSSPDDHSFLFADQEFHKSLLLVIQEDQDFTVGVLLNHPSKATESLTDLPIRFGGDFNFLEDGSTMPAFCLHYLGGVVGGEPVGDYFYKASMDQAAAAIKEGLANPDDFIVLQGMTVWPKDEFTTLVGDSGCFEVVEPDIIPEVWQLLTTQQRLSPLAMETNLDIGRKAWQIATQKEHHGETRLLDLGMDAVKTWLAAYLLQDPDYRP